MTTVTNRETTSKRRRALRLAALAIGLLALMLLLGAFGVWQILSTVGRSGRDLTGLDGVWRDEDSPKHLYRFRPDGKIENSWGGLPFGEAGTWDRDGATITIHSIRDWDFEAELDGGEIRGRLIQRSTGNAGGPHAWKHEWPE
jgi:hypothetical protein